MAQVPEIKIQLDEEALRDQIRSVIANEFEQLSWRLRYAADALDGGKFSDEQDKMSDFHYQRGYEAGLAKAERAYDDH